MNLYPISDLERFSGIRSHTIRIWEKRYKALRPHRSAGNTRYYDNGQLRRLLNIVSLCENGYKISRIGSLLDKQLAQLLDKAIKDTAAVKPYEYFISGMIITSLQYDEAAFEKLFTAACTRFGFKGTYEQIIYPLLLRVGLLWQAEAVRVAQEHFLSNIIRRKLFTAINLIAVPESTDDGWLLFLPANEYHDIGLLFANYLIRLSGKKVIFLGSNVPITSLKTGVRDTRPRHLLLFLVHHDAIGQTQRYVNSLHKNFRNCTIHLAGNDKLIGSLKLKKETSWIRSADQLKKILSDKK